MKQQSKFQFNNRAISFLPAHDVDARSKSAEYSDTTVLGLRLAVGKNGSKRFSFRYTLLSGRTRYAPIGTFSAAFGVAEARAAAMAMRAIVDRGGDPLEDRDRQKAMPTFSEFVRGSYIQFAYQTKRSAHDDDSKFRLHLEPKFGHLRLCDVTPRDIQMHHAAMHESHSAATANRHLALLSATFRKAVEWGHLDRNPVAGIKAFKENNLMQNFLSPAEVARFFAALDGDANVTATAALKLLLLTGVRREEALRAEWRHVDLETGQWWVPMSKSGRGFYVALNTASRELLSTLASRGESPWVFPGRDGKKPISNVRKAMTRALAIAELQHMRIHDLRHSFASLAINSGATLFEVQALLHQASHQVTQRYAHLADSGLKRATQAVSEVVSAALVDAAREAGAMAAA